MAENKEQESTKGEKVQAKNKRLAARQAHEKANKERQQKQNEINASYETIKDEPALLDIIEQIDNLRRYNLETAESGVGVEYVKDDDGKVIDEKTIYFNNDQRMSHTDRAAGLNQIKKYINRRLAGTPSGKLTGKKEE